jgi:hypothetical protein
VSARGAIGLAGLAVALHRIGTRSGATTAEVHGMLPGDGIVPDALWESTRAITIGAAPERVWPWIVQMGFPTYRGGWYTPYWLDRLQWGITAHSADRIVPELQQLAVGDRVPDSIDWSAYFTVEQIDPGRALVLHSTRHLLKPMRSNNFSWSFVLQPAPGGATRLVIRARGRIEPRLARIVLGPPIWVGDFVNASIMLRAIRRRAERTS